MRKGMSADVVGLLSAIFLICVAEVAARLIARTGRR